MDRPSTMLGCVQWRKSRGGQGGHVPPNVGWGGDGNASCPPPKYGGDFVE